MATSPKHVVIIGHGLSGCSVAKDLVDKCKQRGAPSITITVVDSRDFYETDSEERSGARSLRLAPCAASIDACQRESVRVVPHTNVVTWLHGPVHTNSLCTLTT